MSAPVEMSQQRVLVDVDEHVATVTLSRPEKHNALDTPMFEAIVLAAEQVAHAPAIRCVVLHGAGPSFCSAKKSGNIHSWASESAIYTAAVVVQAHRRRATHRTIIR